jgi:hypothetical protein
MADWKTVGGQVVAVGAPILGRIIGEFIPIPGGGLLAEWGIRKLGEALGVPATEATPDRLANEIQNVPPDVLKTKLETAEREAEDRWQALTAMHKATAEQNTASGAAINETQRAEIAAGVSWWHWRHQIGYCTLAFGWVTVVAFAAAMFWGGVNIPEVTALITAVMPVIGILAALNGYVAADTTALKMAAVTGQPQPSAAATIIEAVKPKKK